MIPIRGRGMNLWIIQPIQTQITAVTQIIPAVRIMIATKTTRAVDMIQIIPILLMTIPAVDTMILTMSTVFQMANRTNK